ncbi:S8 family serine peptidase [Okeania sp. SIO2B3]|uniref:S8 family serine peptidase n=1 Tax=Okeania sp. SIO2B3 TaxID=2607784 RepID=UPI0013BFC7F7|nr:S8 family serine peptidase [Okeania sp. SIO2B3]NET40724.1 S8 family serine peptidase [Okeania sp. SIO2B3]
MEKTTELLGPLNELESPLNNFVVGDQDIIPLDKFSGSDEETNLPPVLNVEEHTDDILLTNIDSFDGFRNATDQSSTDEKEVIVGRFEQEDLKDLGTENADLLTGLPKEESSDNSPEKPTDVTLPKEEKISVDDGEKSETDVVNIPPEGKFTETPSSIASLEPEEKVSPEVLEAIANGEAQELLVSLDTTEIDALVEARMVEQGLEAGSDEILEYKAELLAELKEEVFSDLPEGFEIIDDYGNLPISFVRFESQEPLLELLENDDVLAAAVPEVNETFLPQSLPIINQPEAEAAGYTGDGTTVAVLDTGANPNAPGLENRIVFAQDFGNDDGQDDNDGHGTNVSAIVAGVAPGTNIAALDVFAGFDDEGKPISFSSDQIAAINWVIENKNTYNIEAINMSLGGRTKITDPLSDASSARGLAIAEAKSAGILTIVASGNNGYTDGISAPAAFESAVSVGATYDYTGNYGTRDFDVVPDRVAVFSNSAQFLDILAPGAFINAGGLNLPGTSMAAPHVAGAVAVLSEAFPDESPDEILQRMLNSGDPITDHRNGITKPRLNLGAALEVETTRPDNDNFLDSEILFGTSDSDSGTNVNATAQSGEPNHVTSVGENNSVWWSWTAPTSGEVTVNTFGSDFDTVLAAYTGSSVSNLTAITGNDDTFDEDNNSGLQSQIVFDVTGGTTYHFAVDGYSNRTGNIELDLSLETIAVENDNLSNSISLSGSSTSATGSNVDATKESGEPNHAGNDGGSSVWWDWTAPSSGSVTIGTDGSDFDTILGIYTGSSVSDLTEVASDDDGGDGLQSQVTFDVVGGTNYQIAVDGYSGSEGNIVLDLDLATSQISNDDFANSANLSGTSDNATASTINASIEFGEPDHAGISGGHSLWWNWTAPSSGLVTIDTFGSDFDTILAAYTGSSVSNLTDIASNDDSSGLQSQIVFPAEAGTNYQIAVDGYLGAAGNVELALLLEADTLANDDFADRISLSGSQINETATNENATVESAEPLHAGNDGGASLWWSWTAPSDGTLTVNTGGSDFDTILAAYTGSSLFNLTEVDSNDDSVNYGLQSEIIFDVVGGETYNIAVDGFNGSVGNINLELILSTFEDQIDLSSDVFAITSQEVGPGDSIDIDFSVENTGSDDATGFWVDFFLSEDGDIDPQEDYLLGFTWVEELPGNSNTGVLSESFFLPTINEFSWDENADYQIGMLVDSFDFVAETDELNNTITETISISTTTSSEPSYISTPVTINGEYEPIAGDFNGDNNTDILWYRPGPSQDFIWFFNSDNSYDSSPFTVNGTYTPIVGDFNGDSTSDILWYRPGSGQDFIWFFDKDGNRTSSPFTVNGVYTPVAGDFDASGTTDILWYQPGTAQDFLWSFNSDGTFESSPFTVNGVYTPVAGDFDASGTTDILWYRPGTAQDFLWSFNSDGTFESSPFTVNGVYTPVAGDFDASGTTDILWYRPGTAQDFLWSFNSEGTFESSPFTVNGTYTPITGDFNGNVFSDILWYRPGTAQDFLWSFQ